MWSMWTDNFLIQRFFCYRCSDFPWWTWASSRCWSWSRRPHSWGWLDIYSDSHKHLSPWIWKSLIRCTLFHSRNSSGLWNKKFIYVQFKYCFKQHDFAWLESVFTLWFYFVYPTSMLECAKSRESLFKVEQDGFRPVLWQQQGQYFMPYAEKMC